MHARVAVLTLAVLAAAGVAAGAQPLTAQQVIARIQAHVGVPWSEPTVDTVKAGDAATPVTGMAVTVMATLDVLQRAAASGKNLVITHEPTFYGHLDQIRELEDEGDAVLAAKLDFIKAHRLVVWRFHDYWHARRPDGIMTGVAAALGWQPYQDPQHASLFTIPSATLRALAATLAAKLQASVVRVVGDANQRVSRVALAPGAASFASHRKLLQDQGVEVLVIGEAREWETVEYVADAVTAKRRKALIVLGHIPSEQAGMDECTRWLKTFVPEVPVEFVPARDPFWRP